LFLDELAGPGEDPTIRARMKKVFVAPTENSDSSEKSRVLRITCASSKLGPREWYSQSRVRLRPRDARASYGGIRIGKAATERLYAALLGPDAEAERCVTRDRTELRANEFFLWLGSAVVGQGRA